MAAGQGTVSIIVPTHNRAAYLKRALDSIRAQSYPRMEIIVIANGCIDDTEQVARDFQRRVESQTRPAADAQIAFTLRVFKETLGGARARNIGMDCARGEYVAFLDDDDFWHPDALSAQVELLNRHDCALVSNCSFYLYERDGREFARPAGAADTGAAELRFGDLSCENKLDGFSRCLTRRSHLGALRIDEGLDALQDWDLWLKILAATGGAARINPLRHVYGRIDNDRISSRYPQIASAQRRFLQSWRGQLDAPSIAYHEMRNRCFRIKARAQTAAGACGHPANPKQQSPRMLSTLISVVARWPQTAKVIFRSSERGDIKRYIHYMLLPLLDINAARMRLWRVGVGKKRVRKLPAALGGM